MKEFHNNKMILHIKAIEADDIPSMDVIGKSDPYLVFKSSTTDKTWKTKYVRNTYSPVWNEEFQIPISKSMDDIITAELWDQDSVSHDDLISTLVFIIKYLPIDKDTNNWYYFNPEKGVKNGGKVRLYMRLERGPN